MNGIYFDYADHDSEVRFTRKAVPELWERVRGYGTRCVLEKFGVVGMCCLDGQNIRSPFGGLH
jgi:hypothetical protein